MKASLFKTSSYMVRGRFFSGCRGAIGFSKSRTNLPRYKYLYLDKVATKKLSFLLYINHIPKFKMTRFSLSEVLLQKVENFCCGESILQLRLRHRFEGCLKNFVGRALRSAIAIHTRHFRAQFRIQMLLLQVEKCVVSMRSS